jgi:Uma2 family endonuclease
MSNVMPIVHPAIDAVIPDGICDHESYRRWAKSDEFPQRGRFAYFHNTVWMDTDMEHAYSHNFVKMAISAVLYHLVSTEDLGQFFMDGMLLSNLEVGLSTEPDAAFVSHERFQRGLVRGIGGQGDDYVELIGVPDMVLEVISRSSVKKDKQDMMDLYWQAGIPEYWLVDARGEELKFDIFRHSSSAYVPTPTDADGFLRSAVFNRSFKLIRGVNRAGEPKFTLEVR